MNCVSIVGRLTRDPDVRYTNSGLSVARFTVAVDRRVKKESNQQNADFPSVVAFGKTAEFIEQYFSKGMKIGITGRLQTGSYEDRDGKKVYTTDVVAENVEFIESKRAEESAEKTQEQLPDDDDFLVVPDNIGEELPFA